MSLIKLIILDDDDEYSFNLCNFLTHNYPETLLVNYCSNAYNIEEWIKKIDPDIILTCEKYYYQILKHFIKPIALLTSGKNSSSLSEIFSIHKYKNVNKIAGDIINSFTNDGNILNSSKETTTKVISVYSASGNVGKTSVAIGICSICSLSGLNVFYLNLEQFQSTSLFYSNNTEYSFSDLIYYAKAQDKNFISKIAAMRCQEPGTNVYFFKQADNPFEINELLPVDISFITNNLKDCGQYDLIVVDMESRFDSCTLEVFQAVDEVLYILTDEEICLHKTNIFLDSLGKLSNSSNQYTFLAHKILYVANKVSNQGLPLSKIMAHQKIISSIPFSSNIMSINFNLMGGPETIYNSFKDIAARYLK
ncbi:MAG: ATPase involved in chromosome partitioning [Eubacterium sp.]|nr:ATPase involved in chromosome partitioning [Eubacterium sp.]